MEIYFNPFYDSSVFLRAEDCGLGKTFEGPDALLAELELRCGLTTVENEHSQRVISYMEAMRKVAANGTMPFYLESFRQDDYGTAELMLGWRDALVRAGWDGKTVIDSEKVRRLSEIEAFFHDQGRADRWREIIAESGKRPLLGPSDLIKVCCRKDALDAVLARLLSNIEKMSGPGSVQYMEKDVTELPEMEILEFDDEYRAHEWIASQELTAADVVAEADTALLGELLRSFGKPQTGAADKGIGPVMRLLPLGVALFRYPADIASLQSFLQSPKNPVGKLYIEREGEDGKKYHVKASIALLQHICANGGLGDGWDGIIRDAKFTYDGKGISARDYDRAVAFLNLWDKSRTLPEGKANVKDVKDFVCRLDKWAAGGIAPEGNLDSQFHALRGSCRAMLRLLDSVGEETADIDRLCRWAAHLTVPVDISSDYARRGSISLTGSLADIHSKAERLIWFASATSNDLPYEYAFLTRSEIEALRDAGLLITGREQAARNLNTLKMDGLSRCSRASIITCRKISGVETTPSAVLARISRDLPAGKGPDVAKPAAGKVNTDLGKAASHDFDSGIVMGFRRERESYSSIDTLIQRPVDYMLDYVKGYVQYGIQEIADVPTVEGNVAHAYIEELGKACGNDPKEMLGRHNECFDELFGRVLSEKGLILCLRENTIELKSFKVSLRESIGVLLDIIISNGLDIVGFEKSLTAEGLIGNKEDGTSADVYAIIDCLLRDPKDGKYLVFDFKYNSGTTYRKKIEENRELQLAVYKKVVETVSGDVKFTGYYAIPRRTLFTADDVLKPHKAVEVVPKDSEKDLFAMASKGYDFRWKQLRNGKLEEGEGMELADMDYYRNQDALGLYPLEPDYNKVNVKASAYGNKNCTLKGGLK